MKEKKDYTVADFSDYHNGNMSAKEMQALEAAALDDPFLADALEGYAFTSTATDDVAELSSGLDLLKKRKKAVTIIPFHKNTWLRVAAMLILIAGAAWIFIIVNKPDDKAPLAVNKSKIEKTENMIASNDTVVSSPADSTTTSDYVSSNTKQLSAGNKQILTNSVSTYETLQSSATAVASEKNDDKNNLTFANTNVAEPSAVLSSDKSTFLQRGNKTTAPLNPKAITTNGLYRDMNADGNIREESAAPASKKDFSNAIANEVFVTNTNTPLKKLSGKVSGVTISGYSNSNAAVTDSVINIVYTAVPLNGLDSFQRYINDQIKSSGRIFRQGRITLGFDVALDGMPENIRVLFSECKPCEEMSVNLLQNGPRWKSGSSNKGTVTINF